MPALAFQTRPFQICAQINKAAKKPGVGTMKVRRVYLQRRLCCSPPGWQTELFIKWIMRLQLYETERNGGLQYERIICSNIFNLKSMKPICKRMLSRIKNPTNIIHQLKTHFFLFEDPLSRNDIVCSQIFHKSFEYTSLNENTFPRFLKKYLPSRCAQLKKPVFHFVYSGILWGEIHKTDRQRKLKTSVARK